MSYIIEYILRISNFSQKFSQNLLPWNFYPMMLMLPHEATQEKPAQYFAHYPFRCCWRLLLFVSFIFSSLGKYIQLFQLSSLGLISSLPILQYILPYASPSCNNSFVIICLSAQLFISGDIKVYLIDCRCNWQMNVIVCNKYVIF